jgi:hypothetical protein
VGLAVYDRESYVSLEDLLIVPRSYKVVIALVEHPLRHLVFVRVHPFLVKVMSPRYLVLQVVYVVDYDRPLYGLVKLSKEVVYSVVARSRPV